MYDLLFQKATASIVIGREQELSCHGYTFIE